MPLGETITVLNKSGKVVSSSKHIVNVFKEARSAYRERKAEINAFRNVEYEEREARRMLKAATIHDDQQSRASGRSSRHPHRAKTQRRHSRPPLERGMTDTFYAADRTRRPGSAHGDDGAIQRRELRRRHTEQLGYDTMQLKTTRSHSEPHIDMDLAYGDVPPPLPVSRYEDERELKDKMSRLTVLLDEANCLQHSVTAIIENLQKNPDALAAVALTLAEVSSIAAKMAPGVLTALKGSFPAVIALLASPQFMIAAGVGIGVTIVALGGFKIIKKLQNGSERELEEPLRLDELRAPELSRIEMWRRGIADAEVHSSGTTVDGEFITPGASRHLVAEGVLDDNRSHASRRSHRTKSKAPKSTAGKSTRSSRSKTTREKAPKKKEPSGLKMLFRRNSH